MESRGPAPLDALKPTCYHTHMKHYKPVWMNSGEVGEVNMMFADDPILGPAARFLNDLMEFINATSDGWAYHGTAEAAGELQGMLDEAKREQHGWANRPENYEAPTRKDVERVCKLAISNLKRKKHYKTINVEAYGASWPVLGSSQGVLQGVLTR